MTQRFSILKLVAIFAVITIVGFASVVAISNWALNDLRVGGPLYGKIKLGNDLVADILPPPEYVIEAYLEATLAHAGSVRRWRRVACDCPNCARITTIAATTGANPISMPR